MKRTRLKRMTHLSSCLMAGLVMTLATAATKAQQDVLPDHFPQSSVSDKPQAAGSQHKSVKSAKKRRQRKAVKATAKTDSQKVGQTGQTNQQVAR